MLSIVVSAFVVVAVISFTALAIWTTYGGIPLLYERVSSLLDFQVTEGNDERGTALHVSGNVRQWRFFCVRGYRITTSSGTLHVTVYTGLAARSFLDSGFEAPAFDISIHVPADVERVLFGSSRKLVWERGVAAVPIS